MMIRAVALATSVSLIFAGPALAQTNVPSAPIDPVISASVAGIDAAHLRADDTALVGFGTRSLFSEQTSTATHGVFGARDWIATQFRDIAKGSGGRMTVTLDTYTAPKTDRTPRDAVSSSVVAVLKGDDPDGRTYVMSSHYDSRNTDNNDGIHDAPGADDNGSAVSAVIEAARALAPHQLHATIIFAAFDGEEQGLYGSDHYAKLLKTGDVNVQGDLNNDIIGSSHGHDGAYDPNHVRLFSEALPFGADRKSTNARGSENDSPSRELARFIQTTATPYVTGMTIETVYRADRFLRGGDQESFTAVGYPAVRFTESHENFDHQHQNVRVENGVQYGDLLQFVDFDYLASVTKLNVAALAALALGPGAPRDAEISTKSLAYDSTLRWAPVAGATSYEIVWRATDAANWEHAKDVGNVTQATVPVIKDDFILGVRAVDAQGHRGVVSVPAPVKF
jgi:Zn-dependent M28 family amino/carboxypeptidase